MRVSPIAIVSAMEPELAALRPLVRVQAEETIAGRRLLHGELMGHSVVLTLSGIGKVAAALTTTLLIERCGVSRLLFTGVAGGLAPGVQVGDVVVASTLLQHDLDCSPLFPRHHIPDLGRAVLDCDAEMSAVLAAAAEAVMATSGEFAPNGAMADREAPEPRAERRSVHRGLVVSGDRFVSTSQESAALRHGLEAALAVEMEGAAMAQVCTAYGRPCAMVRTISDRADDEAHLDFTRFLAEVASPLSRDIVCAALQRWAG